MDIPNPGKSLVEIRLTRSKQIKLVKMEWFLLNDVASESIQHAKHSDKRSKSPVTVTDSTKDERQLTHHETHIIEDGFKLGVEAINSTIHDEDPTISDKELDSIVEEQAPVFEHIKHVIEDGFVVACKEFKVLEEEEDPFVPDGILDENHRVDSVPKKMKW